jgi:oxygen-independent coproporphyrinogen III oxidase
MPLGIYISVPFCRTKCSYCNFASDVFSPRVFDSYVDRLCTDITNARRTAEQMGGKIENEVDSIYLGGGTPTVLESAQLERIFAAVRGQFDANSGSEITVECAPGTLTEALIVKLVNCGVNRVSLGVQSFVDREAAAVGRRHTRTIILQDIARLHAAGITNLNIDLIAGLPHQTSDSWNFSLSETIATGVPHVSVYMLDVDEDSRLGRELLAGGTRYHAHFVPDEDATAEFYLKACEQLESAGIGQYEISNFAREGSESRHNSKYWTRQPYLGFGVDAHSMLAASSEVDSSQSNIDEHRNREGHDFSRADTEQKNKRGFSPRNNDAVRFSTSDSLEQYIAASPLQPSRISRSLALEETFFLGLRLNRGVDLHRIANDFGEELLIPAQGIISDLIASGLLESTNNTIHLTAQGRLLSNEVFERFIDLPNLKDIQHSTATQS